MAGIKEIHKMAVLCFGEANLEVLHKAIHCQPEVDPYHDNALQTRPVALPQGLDQDRVLFALMSVQPLLELIEHDHQLSACRQSWPPPNGGQSLDQTRVRWQCFARLSQPAKQPHFGIRERGLDKDRNDVFGKPRQQPGLYQ